MSEVIVVTSGKGGVGKTTTAANIGTGLAALDKKVVLVDTDIGMRICSCSRQHRPETRLPSHRNR